MPAYVPPFRRRQAEGGSPPEPSSAELPPGHSSRSHNRGAGGPDTGARGGSEGGGRRAFLDSSQEPPVVEPDAYHRDKILQHFRPTTFKNDSATFYDSVDRPKELAYVNLYWGANSLWSNHRIVFTRTGRALLPGYAAAVLEHGPWDLYPDGVPERSFEASEISVKEGTDEAATAEVGEATSTEATADTLQSATANIGKHDSNGQHDSSLSARGIQETSSTKVEPETEDDNFMGRPLPSIDPIEYTPPDHQAIALFEECRKKGRTMVEKHGLFAFVGWYKIGHVKLLAPRSRQLVRMMQLKWERRDHHGRLVYTKVRNPESWRTALSYEWAVVKFEELDPSEAPPPPAIKKLPSDTAEGKGVNEILAELRLRGSAKKTDSSTGESDGAGQSDTSGNQQGIESTSGDGMECDSLLSLSPGPPGVDLPQSCERQLV